MTKLDTRNWEQLLRSDCQTCDNARGRVFERPSSKRGNISSTDILWWFIIAVGNTYVSKTSYKPLWTMRTWQTSSSLEINLFFIFTDVQRRGIAVSPPNLHREILRNEF
jgi:hypothetical protein